jgi:hypothetical protein
MKTFLWHCHQSTKVFDAGQSVQGEDEGEVEDEGQT